MKKTLLFITLCFSSLLYSQNVGINGSGSTPNASAMLDVDATDKGLLLPRVALTDITVALPVTTPTVSLMIYNTATSALATASNNVVPGFYYWNGSKWIAFAGTGSREWSLLGNAGTVAGTNFLGTTDDVDLVFKVNNVEAGRITSNVSDNNSFYGYQSGLNNTSTFNAFFGTLSGKANTSGGNNLGAGFGAMRNSTTGSVNVFLGNNAGANWVTSTGNTGVGNQALQGLSTSTGSYNIGLGFAAGSGFSGGSANNLSQLSGSYNTYVGYSSSGTAASNTFSNSTAIGAFSQAGANNALVLGSISGANNATANTNVGIGITAPVAQLHVNQNSSAVTPLRLSSASTVANVNWNFDIGSSTAASDPKSLTIKGSSASSDFGILPSTASTATLAFVVKGTGNVGINTASPAERLEVQGSVKIVDGTQGATKVLMSDAGGKGSWADVYGSNIQFAEGTTDVTMNSTTFADLPGMTITFTPKHTTVYINVTVSGDMDVSAAGAAMGFTKCRVTDAGATTIYGKVVSIATDYDGSTKNGAWNCSIVCRATGLTVGTATTIKVQWARGGSNAKTIRCSPATTDYSMRSMMITD